MVARPILLAALLTLSGCTSSPDAPADRGGQAERAQRGSPWFEDYLAHGHDVYAAHCATCHDPGAGDAPAIGVRADWDGRSRLWTAVLFEHARAGYLQMPAKGGAPALSDEDVSAAAEYMLTATYPELPVD